MGHTYAWDTEFVLVTNMDIFDSDLDVIDNLCGQRFPQSLRLRRVIYGSILVYRTTEHI